MAEKHLSTQFDSELNTVSTKVMQMGGLVETQVRTAITALSRMSEELCAQVVEAEVHVNRFEVEVDRDVSSIIGRRQPTARDLRLLIGISRITGNLERVGDEAKKIARMVKSIVHSGAGKKLPSADLYMAADTASNLIRRALDAFARLDVEEALLIMREDDIIDREFGNFVRILVTHMMEDPRQISASLDLLFVAKALERIGDQAKNVAEQVIYVAKGADVRHASIEEQEEAIR